MITSLRRFSVSNRLTKNTDSSPQSFFATLKPFVSVIIAVYNSEIWLPRCLRSAISQTLASIEILLIDDGSTDKSPAICDEFASIDPRIRVFHRQNHGISATRQFGLDHAEGEYVIYLDSDDFICPAIYEKMYSRAKECDADIVLCDWFSVYRKRIFHDEIHVNKWDAKHLLYALIEDQPTYPTVFLCRRTLFAQLSVGFPKKSVSYGEDTMMMVSLLDTGITAGHDLIIEHIPEPLYYYDRVINPGSLMKLSKKEMTVTRLRLWSEIGSELHSDIMKKALYNRLVYYLYSSIVNSYFTNDEFHGQYDAWLPEIKRYASDGIKKGIVCRSLEHRLTLPLKSRWIAYPVILREKWAQYCRRFKARPVPSDLAAL